MIKATENEDKIRQIEQIFMSEMLAYENSEQFKKDIDAAENRIDAGHYFTTEEVKQKLKAKFLYLK